ncbi:hypothetical protein STRDD10_01655 [Streptococcus sp. DD10]|uniref:YesL family protein n=1 Tax=Streptococcus sp. DD10 TaxID=1777878 RepID=UPI0007934E0B|nr:YesL family protein [Streptococcus sp. DD10]KXT73059.1 hypothetical protein STRDD10_01655 [Streptococcus sp. DD10]
MQGRGSQLLRTVFDTDNFLMRIAEKVLDMVTVNLLFVLTCLPIVTIGIAKISLYQTLFVIKGSRRVPVIRTYLRAFKSNWKQGFQLGLLELAVVGICWFDLGLFWGQSSLSFQILKAVCLGIFIFLMLTMLAVYPLASRYELGLRECLQKAVLLISLNFAWFFLMVAVILLILMLLYLSVFTLLLGGSAFLLFGFALLGFMQVGIMERIFTKYQ